MPAGRPSKYQARYCADIVEFMAQGYSKTAFAGSIGVCHDTIIEWAKQHPEFSDAVKRGQAARTMTLEQTLIAGETGPKVTAHIFALKNAAPDEWKDKVTQEHTGKDGGAIVIEQVENDAHHFTSTVLGLASRARAERPASKTKH